MLAKLKDLIIGPALPTRMEGQRQVNIFRGLAAFSPDALASIAYANQEIYLGLVAAGAAGLAYAWPIGLGITGLLVIVALSYYQTIHGYPQGGGSYTVARANLGDLPGLLAAAALMVDYLLNAAVSLTAGVAAIASATARVLFTPSINGKWVIWLALVPTTTGSSSALALSRVSTAS